jgi:hypothetical protein
VRSTARGLLPSSRFRFDVSPTAPVRHSDSRGIDETRQRSLADYGEQSLRRRNSTSDAARSVSSHGSATQSLCAARKCEVARVIVSTVKIFDSVVGNSSFGVKLLRFPSTHAPSEERCHSIRQSLYQELAPWQTMLVRLCQGRPPDVLEPPFVQADLVTVDFADINGIGITGTTEIVQYSAVSHVWGKDGAASGVFVEINGHGMKVAANVASVLERLTQRKARDTFGEFDLE